MMSLPVLQSTVMRGGQLLLLALTLMHTCQLTTAAAGEKVVFADLTSCVLAHFRPCPGAISIQNVITPIMLWLCHSFVILSIFASIC